MGEEGNQIVLVFIVSAAVVVVLVVLLILFLIIYQKRIVTQENRLQKLENEKQRALLVATIEGQERERKRLAKDLHDGIGSLLSGLSLNLKFQKKREGLDPKQIEFLDQACVMVEDGIKNVRSVSHNLMPATLENFGLLSAMKECIEPVDQVSGVDIKIASTGEAYKIPDTKALGLLRIFQELLQNTLKHSGATRVLSEVNFSSNKVGLLYTDNGKGPDDDIYESKGIGIKNILSRVQAMDGTFEIILQEGSGFKAQVDVPVVSKE